jgi:hypothetical protein
MLYAVLICSDEGCAEEFEAWGDLLDFDVMVCEGCGCLLQPIGFAEADPMRLVHFPRRAPFVQQLRDAA